MTAGNANRVRPGLVLIRVAACLLLAASFAMLFLPWISLSFEEYGLRYTLRELAEKASLRGVDELPTSLSQGERELYEKLLPELDALRDDRVSPLSIALGCLGCSRVLFQQSNAPALSDAAAQTLETYASTLQLTGIFLLVLLGFLAVTCLWALWSAATGYGFGVIPYLFGSLPGIFALAFGSSILNGWYQGSSASANALRAAVSSYRLSGNPASEPFRVTGFALLFPALLAGGVLLAFCALRGREEKRQAQSRSPLPAGQELPVQNRNVWRCPQCGTLMGDGIYCVNCGERKLEPRLCAFCGERLEDGAQFCGLCGTPIPRPGVPLPRAPRPQPKAPESAPLGTQSAVRENVSAPGPGASAARESVPADPGQWGNLWSPDDAGF